MGHALARADAEMFGPRREKHVEDLLDCYMEDGNIEEILGYLKTSPHSQDLNIVSRLQQRWANEKPAEMAEWASRLPVGDERRQMLDLAAMTWSRRDAPSATAAREWVATLPESEQTRALTNVAYGSSAHDPTEALALATTLPEAGMRDQVIGDLTLVWASSDLDATLKWLGEMEDMPFKNTLLSRVTAGLAEMEPAQAAKIALDQLPQGPVQDTALIQIARLWARNDAPAATKWATALPDSELKTAILTNLAAPVKETDASTASP